MQHLSTYTKLIKQEALKLGFNDCGISKAEMLSDDFKILQTWLANNYHAGLKYMERNTDKRKDINKLVDGAKSVISVILNYYPSERQKDPAAPVISKYALGPDYHDVVKKKLIRLMEYIRTIIPGAEGKVFVDSAPILEHAWARRAGLGWIGKNSLLITKKFGSFIFIGELIVNIELEYDNPSSDMCGNCRKCIISCPTGAITEGRMVDANKCISYLTIENKTDIIPEELRERFINRVFGCDICQDICPWNKKLDPHKTEELKPHSDLISMTKEQWYSINQDQFKVLFKNSPIKRAKFRGLIRNLSFLR